MNQGVYPLAANMINQLNRVEVSANNIANVNTTGFKEDRVVEGSFNYYLQRAKKEKFQPTKIDTISNTVPKIDGNYMINSVGGIVQTGNKLDFAIKEKDLFFKIKDDRGNILLTRDGSFKNLNGFLVTSEGYNVLNRANQPILVNDGFENQIALIKTDFKNLQKKGNNNYQILDNKKTTLIQNNDNKMFQGTLEKSNVNAIKSMVELISAQRRVEQTQKAITGIDEINTKVIRINP